MPKFTESKLEQAFIELLDKQGYPHFKGEKLDRKKDEVLLKDDFIAYLKDRYKSENLSSFEIESIFLQIRNLSLNSIYENNKKFLRWLSDGFLFKRDKNKKDIFIELIDFSEENKNIYKFVTQLEIEGQSLRIPDGVIFINGIPLVVFEFKSAISENATISDAYKQLTTRYKRDIEELFYYNAFCVISDGVNNKAGSFFAPYEFFYAWRRVSYDKKSSDGIDSLFTLVNGMLNQDTLRDIVKNFIYIPDSSKKEEKILCRYPQYYAVKALHKSIKKAKKPLGDGKGGTYFGATGSGKSYTMLYLSRALMKDEELNSPTIVLITDRTDLDDQLSKQFNNAKKFIGDEVIQSVESRADLRDKLLQRKSGGVFLTTIQKFSEDLKLLSDRENIICISDEAHRSQINLEQKVRVTQNGVIKSYGFAKYLHDSLPNAVYVGFSGTPIDATLDVFGDIVDAYTMKESVEDEITVPIVYEGRVAKVALDESWLQKIEEYYESALDDGANEYQVQKSKKAMASMHSILGDEDRLEALAKDFVSHYEKRVQEGSTVSAKAMFVCYDRQIAYKFYKKVTTLKPEWLEKKAYSKKSVAIEYIKMVMTRNKDDDKELYELLGTKEYRKDLDKYFKDEKSNFKIAIVVDMWLTGFDVPSLDTIYIDKPISKHNLIQTISRVNRKYKGKNRGLVVDYIGIKKQMNLALAHYNKADRDNFEDIEQSLVVLKDQLEILEKMFLKFDSTKYFNGSPLEQLNTLNLAVEYIQQTKELENRFIGIVKRLKASYDICVGSEKLEQKTRDLIHFYLAIRTIIIKLTKGEAPDIYKMNQNVAKMIEEAIKSSGVEEVFSLSDDENLQNIFDKDYMEKLNKIKLPNTKIKLLQKLLSKAISGLKRVNKIKGVDFSKKMQNLVEKYNDRKEQDILKSEVYEELADELTNLLWEVSREFETDIDFEVKAFYDILDSLCKKYDFYYDEEKLLLLSNAVKELVEKQAKFPDWDKREDIKAMLKVELILLLDEYDYPPVQRDEVYQEIFEQAENFKKYKG